MSSPVALTKMHGARNDFLILDARTVPVAALEPFALRVCDRHSGVGADGLIVIEAGRDGGFVMHTINSDGSEAEMCGNGVRCAARWLDEAGEGDRIAFTTPAGTIRTRIVARQPEYLVEVEMPAPHVAPIAFETFELAYRADLGNPHLVVFVASIDDVDLAALAARAQRDRRFPAGVNVHVAETLERGLRVRHWERGAGETQACGTGAVAAAAAGIAYRGFPSPLEVHVPGGRLVVEWEARGAVRLTGPAERVFETTVRADR